jgi:two-component system sensor histidine kinase HydH
VSDLALVLAHRLRSLVGGVQAAGELLVDVVEEADRPLAFNVLEGAAAIERVLADLVRYCHRLEPLPRPLCLSALASDVAGALAPADAARVRVAGAGFVPVVGDPLLLQQAALALVQNALEAAPGAHVEVAVRAAGGTAELRVTQPGAVAAVPPERVFDPFYTTKPQHLGLGLALAKRIAEAHGGDIRVFLNSSLVETVTLALILRHAPSSLDPSPSW